MYDFACTIVAFVRNACVMRMNKFDQKLIINKQILQTDSPQVKSVILLVLCVESSFTVFTARCLGEKTDRCDCYKRNIQFQP